jgi:hypothetical protein
VNDQLGDDMLLYKLSDERVLSWLKGKQERVYQVLLHDDALANTVVERYMSTKSHGFHLLDDNDNDTDGDGPVPNTSSEIPRETLDRTVQEESRLMQHHSIQIVCEYISPEWRTQFLTHLGQPESCI